MSVGFPNLEEEVETLQGDRELQRAIAAEFVGTALLLTAIVGSGIMAWQLASGTLGLALFMHAIAVGTFLIVLIHAFGPISGAHFNPAVSFGFWWLGELGTRRAILYVIAQIIGGIVGVMLAHAMFQIDLIDIGTRERTGYGQAVGEFVATFVLMFVILAVRHSAPRAVPTIVGFVIIAGILYTSSASFANPAVSIARQLTDTFAGMRPLDVPVFVVMELLAAVVAVILYRWMYSDAPRKD